MSVSANSWYCDRPISFGLAASSLKYTLKKWRIPAGESKPKSERWNEGEIFEPHVAHHSSSSI
jgi:hypothetical protein